MEIKATKDFSNEGNDCWINKSASLVDSFGALYIIIHTKVSGWTTVDEVDVLSVSEWKRNNRYNGDEIQVFVDDYLNKQGLI